MNRRQKKKLWSSIQRRELKQRKAGIVWLGGGIMLPNGWIYNKQGSPVKLIDGGKK